MAVGFTNTTGQYLDFGNLTSVVGLSQKTLLIWLNLTSTPAASQTIFEIYHASSTNELFFAIANFGADAGKFGVGQRFTGNDGEWRTTNDILVTGANFIAVTYDASSSANTPVMYYAGASVPVTTATAATGTAELSTASTIRIGAGQFINKSIDGNSVSICYYNRIFSAQEIADAYSSKLAIPDRRGLVFAPQFQGCAGGVAEGGTMAAGNTVADAVSGALGVPAGSPVFKGDTVLTYQS